VNVLVPQTKPDFKRLDHGGEGRMLDVPTRPPLHPVTPGTPVLTKKLTFAKEELIAGPIKEVKP
jgi:hypothetical protein